MKKLTCALLLFAASLWAADFWQSKPFTEWSDKDLQKMINNSPWARSISISTGGPTPPALAGGTAAGAAGTDTGAPPPISEGGGGGRGGRGGGPAATGGIPAEASINLVFRWQNALPVKQALVKLKYGAEAATSLEAKQLLEREEMSYVIVLSGQLRSFLRGDSESLKKAAIDQTSLSVKGKGALKPADVQFGAGDRAVEVYYFFPRSAAYTLEDKEVEFATKMGDLTLKNKFRFKDMVINGKLEL